MNEENFQAENLELDEIFQQYRLACPEVEPSANFMPVLWQKIDGKRTVWSRFVQMGKNALAVSGALCLLLLAMNLTAPPQVASNYAEALLAEDAPEHIVYSEVSLPAAAEQAMPAVR